jgi:hypothetical protein
VSLPALNRLRQAITKPPEPLVATAAWFSCPLVYVLI